MRSWWRRVPQATRILVALAAGLAIGMAMAGWRADWALAAASVTQPIGAAWLHGLQMVIVPLVTGLIVTGIAAAAEAARAGRIAARALASFVAILWTTTLMSAALMPVLLRLFPLPPEWATALRRSLTAAAPAGEVPGLAAFFDAVVPSNVVAAAAADAFLPLTVFALVFGFAVAQLEPASRDRLTGLFQALVDAMLVIVGWVLRLAPVGVFMLAYGVGARTGVAAVGALLHYIVLVSSIGVVVLALAYPLAAVAGRVGLLRFARAVAPAQAVAISTQSSLATLPAMLKGCERLGVPATTAGIVLPMAVAVFRATSPAMNLAVALYVAQLTGTEIGAGAMAAGIATAAITTMGSVSLPGTISFFASVAPVALAMGVPLEALALLVAVETIPDLFRTVGNATMDVAVTRYVARAEGVAT
ncbi:dicarboxylate/amino acid:cation symporter [Sphingomonas sp. 1P08PE]|uniref:dicarboxylate/amino acid:cation symporter n=1 Tax=Sphingomonas sp. 1P08PE TaxID=554122 RepID=UPI0039A16F28